MTAPRPPDAGSPVERTVLAWRRTALALAAVSAAEIRFAVPVIGWAAVPVGAAGVTLALLAYLATGRRQRQVRSSAGTTSGYRSSGWPPAATAGATVLLGVSALVFLAHQLA